MTTDGLTPKEWEDRAKQDTGREKKLVFNVAAELFYEEKLNWLAIGQDFVKKNPLYYDRAGLWWSWSWSKDVYEIIDETDLLIMIDRATRKYNLKSGLKAEILEGLRRASREFSPLPPPKTWIQFGEQIYDYEKKTIEKATPNYFFTNSIPWKIGDTAETPTIDLLFKEWGGNKSDLLKEIMAFCCIRDYPMQRIFVLLGGGSNGKSTYLRILDKFLGEENVCSAELDLITTDRFQSSLLFNKLCCQMGETNFGTLKNTARLKNLSGNDSVTIQFKNKNGFNTRLYAKIIIATNSLPPTLDKTDGFYRRWLVITFENQYSEKRDVFSEVPDIEYNNLARWCCEAISSMMETRKFSNEGTILDRKRAYESMSNPLETFIASRCEKRDDFKVSASSFFGNFQGYLSQNGLRSLNYQEVRTSMMEMGYEYARDRFLFIGDNPVASIRGLQFRVNVPDVPALSISPYIGKNEIETGHTADTLTQKLNVLDQVRALFKYKVGFVLPTEYIQEHVPLASDDWLKNSWGNGDLMESPAGMWSLLH